MEGPREKTVIIVGVPGVGKSTIISNAIITLQKRNDFEHSGFWICYVRGNKKLGINDRDQIRKQTIDVQQRLQNMTADHISSLNDSIVVVDTHLFIKTQSGYYPGLPMSLILN